MLARVDSAAAATRIFRGTNVLRYADGVAFRVVFPSTGPPRIRQATLGATAVVGDDADHHGRRCGLEFYAALLEAHGDEPGDAFSLPKVLKGLCDALVDDGSRRWSALAGQHARRRSVIEKYRGDFPAHRLGAFTELDERDALVLAVAGRDGPFAPPLLPKTALAPRLVNGPRLAYSTVPARPGARSLQLAAAASPRLSFGVSSSRPRRRRDCRRRRRVWQKRRRRSRR